MTRRSIAITVVVVCLLALSTAAVAADDPFLGMWKLNTAKSTLTSGQMPKSWVTKITAIKGGLQTEGDITDAEGKSTHRSETFLLDGIDHSSPSNPEIIERCTRTTNSFKCITTRKGKEVSRMVDTVSDGGKTGTLTVSGINAQGQQINEVYIWDRQ